MNKFIEMIKYRWYCLEEVCQRGYSWSYRWFRFKEALGFNPYIGVNPTLALVEEEDDYRPSVYISAVIKKEDKNEA